MPYTYDDCSRLCWPEDASWPSRRPENHEECERQLMDFSDPDKQWAYCADDCHHVPGLPGYNEMTSGRYVTRNDVLLIKEKK